MVNHKLIMVGLLSVVAAGVSWLAFAVTNSGDTGVEPDYRPGMIVESRASLKICVDAAPSLQATRAELIERLQVALIIIRAHPDWEDAGYGPAIPTVEDGCPGGYVAPATLVEKGTAIGPGIVDQPSVYRAAILLLDDIDADVGLGNGDGAILPFEIVCEEHECFEVTTALVIRGSVLDEGPTLVDHQPPGEISLPNAEAQEGGASFDLEGLLTQALGLEVEEGDPVIVR